MANRKTEAENLLREPKEVQSGTYVPGTIIAMIYAVLGEKDLAFESLNRVVRDGTSTIVALSEPMFEHRTDPRFHETLEKIGLAVTAGSSSESPLVRLNEGSGEIPSGVAREIPLIARMMALKVRTLRITPIDFSQNLLFAAAKNPIARVLGQARVVGNMEQTVFTLAEATKLDIETVQSALQHLTQLGLVQPTRKIGNAQAYKFNVENGLHTALGRTG